jgi:hypothetical protein
MVTRVFQAIACAIALALGAMASAQELQLAPATGGDPQGVETLTQGPIHEAFANPTDLDATPGPIATRQPPPDIQEEPPEYMPEDSAWIGGYWVWDDDRDDFIWVTGVARKTPPGMRYVPGYWTEANGGWQRVSGFWTSAEATEIAYRQPPPNSLEAGPSSPAPADNYFWVPGNWTYYDTGYRWRGGYWTPYQPDWVWVPARWVWTPGGFVYLPGFWDYQLAYRGQFFAPIYFQQPVYLQPTYVYRPWCVIPTSNLFIHLWIRPNHCHYYFGNYYGPRYVTAGFQPWCSYAHQRRHYDPFVSYCSVHYRRQGVDFVGRVQDWHNYYDRHEDHRPARTWREQQVAHRAQPRETLETQLVARNIVEVAERNDAPVRLTKLDSKTKQAQLERTKELRELNTSRKDVERQAAQVVARLPRPDRDAAAGGAIREPGEKSKTAADRGGKGAKGVPDVAGTPAGVSPPKLKLPKDTMATAVVRGNGPAANGPAAKGPGTNGKGAGNKGQAATDNRGNSAGRGNVGRPDRVPPPMPDAANATAGDRVRRGGSPEKSIERSGAAAAAGAQSGNTPPRGGTPANLLPGAKGELPPAPPPADDASKGRSPKGKGQERDAGDDSAKGKENSKGKAKSLPESPRDIPGRGKAKGTELERLPADEAPRSKPQPKPELPGASDRGESDRGVSDRGQAADVAPPLAAPRENLTPQPNIIPGASPSVRSGNLARPPKASDAVSRSKGREKTRDSQRDKSKEERDKSKERP